MSISLYASPGSCSLAPHIVLEELGCPYSLVPVSTDAKDTRTGSFRDLNPKGRVPVLVRNDVILTEAPAILFDLAASSPEADLFPRGPDGLVRSIEWFNWLSGTVHSVAVRMIWRPGDFTSDPSNHPGIVETGKGHLAVAFAAIETFMGADTYAVGQTYSIVDPYLLVFFRWGNRMRIDMRQDYPHWTRHATRLLARPAVARAFAQERISAWE